MATVAVATAAVATVAVATVADKAADRGERVAGVERAAARAEAAEAAEAVEVAEAAEAAAAPTDLARHAYRSCSSQTCAHFWCTFGRLRGPLR